MAENVQNKPVEIIYNQTKFQIISMINQIISQNNVPSFLTSIILKDIANDTINMSLESIIAQNEVVSKSDYQEFIDYKNNQNNKKNETE